MERQTRRTVLLTPEEIKEAVTEYVRLHTCGELECGENTVVFAVTSDAGRHADFNLEAQWFE